jgi:tetratricopeptide (TPR) repeat protein
VAAAVLAALAVSAGAADALSLNNHAAQLATSGHYAEAIPLYRAALAGTDQPLRQATIAHNLAVACRRLGQYEEAEKRFRQVIELRRAALPAGHADIARAYNSLGDLLHTLGRYDEAIPYLERAFLLLERNRHSQESELLFAVVLNNLGTAHLAFNRVDEAARLLTASLEIKQRLFGPEDPQVAVAANNLGQALAQRRKYREAAVQHRRAVAIWEQHGAAARADLAVGMLNLSRVARLQNDFDSAAVWLERAGAVLGAKPTADPGVAAALLHQQGALALDLRAFAEAERMLGASLAARERLYGSTHPALLDVLADYARLLRATGRKQAAVAVEARRVVVLAHCRRTDPARHAVSYSSLRAGQ